MENITKRFGKVTANKDVTLELYKGEILSLLGENGSGKTTLMNMIAGIYYPDGGQIIVNGQPADIRSPRDALALGIGMIHQHFKLVDVFTAVENIALSMDKGEKFDLRRVRDKARAICEKYQFALDLDQKVYEMSVSQKQTLEIVETALEARRLLAFAYLDRFGNRSERAVEPCRLVLKGDQWYFQGYCLLRNDYRLFRLSRMLDVRMREESFLPREAPRPELDTGEIVASLRAEITLRVHASAVDRVMEYCAFDRFTPDGDEYYLVRFPFIDREYYYDRLLSFGDRCECVAPARVREKLRQRIRRLAEMYQ